MTRQKITDVFLIFVCVLSFLGVVMPAYADDRDKAFDILDAWTSLRWGEDNLAWVVHYSEELVDPWVISEAERQKMRPEQAEEFRKSFEGELRIGSATAVLLSVYGYGTSPLNLSPMEKNIALINSSGERVNPIVFEKRLESPISGLVQGFVFFPIQTDKNFRIVVNGLVPGRETNFTFPGTGQSGNIIATIPDTAPTPSRPSGSSGKKEEVVKIPTRRNNSPEKPDKPTPQSSGAIEEPVFEDTGEVFAPTEPVVPTPEPKPESVPEPALPPAASQNDGAKSPSLPPKQVLDMYLRAWIDGDTDKMYSLLSTESQGRISKELFIKETTSGNFRSSLRSGYKVNWVGDAARVTVAKKVLFVRTLETKQINFVMENGSARVTW